MQIRKVTVTPHIRDTFIQLQSKTEFSSVWILLVYLNQRDLKELQGTEEMKHDVAVHDLSFQISEL